MKIIEQSRWRILKCCPIGIVAVKIRDDDDEPRRGMLLARFEVRHSGRLRPLDILHYTVIQRRGRREESYRRHVWSREDNDRIRRAVRETTAMLSAIRAAGLSAWDAVPDPDAMIREMRGEEPTP